GGNLLEKVLRPPPCPLPLSKTFYTVCGDFFFSAGLHTNKDIIKNLGKRKGVLLSPAKLIF
ncbi:MAG: hypothetical protein JXB23_16160, partial [Candidatus Aminicenantes bacterium]|nr:hypothetical protein [Candidatus Aminicenantes bacterium]